jgi:hypothetical protein
LRERRGGCRGDFLPRSKRHALGASPRRQQLGQIPQEPDGQPQLVRLSRVWRNDPGDILQQVDDCHAGRNGRRGVGVALLPRAGTRPVANHVCHGAHHDERHTTAFTENVMSPPAHHVPVTVHMIVRWIIGCAKCATFKFGAEHNGDSLPRSSRPHSFAKSANGPPARSQRQLRLSPGAGEGEGVKLPGFLKAVVSLRHGSVCLESHRECVTNEHPRPSGAWTGHPLESERCVGRVRPRTFYCAGSFLGNISVKVGGPRDSYARLLRRLVLRHL